MTRAVGLAAIEVPIPKSRGRVAFSSSLMSYEMTKWASIELSVLAAKNRPGLQKYTKAQNLCSDSEGGVLPCVSAVSKYQVFRVSHGKLVFHAAVFGTHVGKTEGIEHPRIIVYFVVEVHGLAGDPNQNPFRYDGSVGKRDVFLGLSHHVY